MIKNRAYWSKVPNHHHTSGQRQNEIVKQKKWIFCKHKLCKVNILWDTITQTQTYTLTFTHHFTCIYGAHKLTLENIYANSGYKLM